jgi:hypothetical protein
MRKQVVVRETIMVVFRSLTISDRGMYCMVLCCMVLYDLTRGFDDE